MIKEVKMYNAACDTCGFEAEFGDYTCYSSREAVKDDILTQGWTISDTGECTCDECVLKLALEAEQ
jgi:hypothetical protein